MMPDAIDCGPEPIRDSMDSSIDEAKAELLAEYERLGTIDVGVWVTRYPQYRDEIIDFWMWVLGTPRGVELKSGPFPAEDSDVAEKALRDACLAVNLGPQWLEPAADPSIVAVRDMALALEALRGKPQSGRGKAPVAFRKAVVWTWVVSIFQGQRPKVTRLAVQKATYLLECAMNLGVFTEHGRKPLGPYDYKARYRDAEPIAIKKGWLKVRGTMQSAADNLADLKRFIGRYLRSEGLAERLVKYLVRFSDDELEVLATVHWSARELVEAGRAVTVAAIIELLESTREWQLKPQRPAFSGDHIGTALQQLRELRLAP
jgi:hypothetical protein